MTMSATWDALQLVGDALQVGDLDGADRVLAAMDIEGAWDFELVEFSPRQLRRMLAGMAEANAANLCDIDAEYVPPSWMQDLVSGMSSVRFAYQYARKHGAPDEIMAKLVRWMGDAQRMMGPPVDAIEMRVRSWPTMITYQPHAWYLDGVA